MAGSVVGTAGVVLLDELMGILEILETVGKLLNIVDDLAELGDVVHELELDRADGIDSSHGGSEGEGFHSKEQKVYYYKQIVPFFA